METERRDLLMAMSTVVIIKTIALMDSGLMDGEVAPIMKEVSKMDFVMERVNGHQDKQNTREITLKALNKGMDNCISQVAIFTKAILSRTNGKDMGKCFGQMAPSIRVIGKEGYKMGKGKSTLWGVK
jgi:hypothetical protein